MRWRSGALTRPTWSGPVAPAVSGRTNPHLPREYDSLVTLTRLSRSCGPHGLRRFQHSHHVASGSLANVASQKTCGTLDPDQSSALLLEDGIRTYCSRIPFTECS